MLSSDSITGDILSPCQRVMAAHRFNPFFKMSKKIIPDIHGRQFWKTINPEQSSKIVFLADYVDSFRISAEKQYRNLLGIIELKNKYPEKIILLLGNHDIQYLFISEMKHRCSGFQPKEANKFHWLFNDNKELFQNCYWDSEDKILYSHAGMTNALFDNLTQKYWPYNGDMGEICDNINRYSPKEIYFNSPVRGGHDAFSGLFWTHTTELEKDGYPIKQVVGHTWQANRKIKYINNKFAVCDIAKIIDVKKLIF